MLQINLIFENKDATINLMFLTGWHQYQQNKTLLLANKYDIISFLVDCNLVVVWIQTKIYQSTFVKITKLWLVSIFKVYSLFG